MDLQEVVKMTVGASASEMDALIRKLGALRAQLRPPISNDASGDATVLNDARVAFMPDEARGGVVMAFRHPGYGWLYLHLQEQTVLGMSKVSCPGTRPKH